MPSDPRVTRAFELLAKPIEQYRTAVATTLEEVRGHLAAGRSDAQAHAARLQAQLGVFAAGRIDTSRLSTVLGNRDALDVASLQRLERASDTLRNIVSRGSELLQLTVPPGEDMARCVSARLSLVGRAFAAARIAAAAHKSAASGLDEAVALGSFPFAEWSAAERRLAPPLVVTVEGADLVAGSLAPFLDGMHKFLLIVDGPCAPAPLVRLITPSVLVIQGYDFKDFEVLSAWPATAVAALVPDTAVRFTHDPAGGSRTWQRISVHLPPDPRVRRLGGLTAAQQSEELLQLESLAAPPPAPMVAPASEAAASAADPVDRLAAWLLQQAQVPSPAPGD
jgi:hypothetical protein